MKLLMTHLLKHDDILIVTKGRSVVLSCSAPSWCWFDTRARRGLSTSLITHVVTGFSWSSPELALGKAWHIALGVIWTSFNNKSGYGTFITRRQVTNLWRSAERTCLIARGPLGRVPTAELIIINISWSSSDSGRSFRNITVKYAAKCSIFPTHHS
jgi:hypothetical protein